MEEKVAIETTQDTDCFSDGSDGSRRKFELRKVVRDMTVGEIASEFIEQHHG